MPEVNAERQDGIALAATRSYEPFAEDVAQRCGNPEGSVVNELEDVTPVCQGLLPLIRFACPSCAAVVKVPARKAGRTIPCPRCRSAVPVPSLSAPPAPGNDLPDVPQSSSQWSRRRWLLALVPIFPLAVAVGAGAGLGVGQLLSDGVPSRADLHMSGRELYVSYGSDLPAGDRQYKGKWIELTLEDACIGKDSEGDLYISAVQDRQVEPGRSDLLTNTEPLIDGFPGLRIYIDRSKVSDFARFDGQAKLTVMALCIGVRADDTAIPSYVVVLTRAHLLAD